MLGRVLYGAAFMLALPALLVVWAVMTECAVQLPAPRWPVAGGGVAALGLSMTVAAMWGLWHRGGGLPMNAFPPKRFVFSGAYRLLPHPIYVGFALMCFGVSLAMGSASGLWLVSPAAVAGMAALVLGYERDAIRARFGDPPAQTLLRLPCDEARAPDVWDRVSVLVLVLLPWCVLYEAIGNLPTPGAIDSRLEFELVWPVWTWTTPIYSLAYPFAVLVPWGILSRRELRRFAVVGLIGTAMGMLAYIVMPVVAMPRAFDSDGAFAWLLRLERADGLGGRNALPAFHVFWAVAAAAAWGARGGAWRVSAWSLCVLIVISCVTTGMHAVLDLPGGLALYACARWSGTIWRQVVHAAERIANSWREWRLGPVRVISHGLFAGIAAAVGMLVAIALAGIGHAATIGAIALCAMIGAALWGQALVGSKTLLRPFGYFGAILGATMGMGAAAAMGAPFWVLSGAMAAAAPWVVLVGRLRCLVQGCCHGRPVKRVPGIRYRHPRSRVCTIARLNDVPVHPTPVYSMASNFVLGLLLIRLWIIGAPLSMVVGIYLLGAGISRFVEEHFRGEPQTRIVGGLRIYQWFAAASVLAGILITWVPTEYASLTLAWDWRVLVYAVGVGAVFGVAMGVDLPESDRRFSRLV